MQYKLILGNPVASLPMEQQIQEHLAQGWILHGSIAQASEGMLGQAMIKPDEALLQASAQSSYDQGFEAGYKQAGLDAEKDQSWQSSLHKSKIDCWKDGYTKAMQILDESNQLEALGILARKQPNPNI